MSRRKRKSIKPYLVFLSSCPVKRKSFGFFIFFSSNTSCQCWKLLHPVPVLEKGKYSKYFMNNIYIIQITMWWIIHCLVGFCGYLSLLLIACFLISNDRATACIILYKFVSFLGVRQGFLINHLLILWIILKAFLLSSFVFFFSKCFVHYVFILSRKLQEGTFIENPSCTNFYWMICRPNKWLRWRCKDSRDISSVWQLNTW